MPPCPIWYLNSVTFIRQREAPCEIPYVYQGHLNILLAHPLLCRSHPSRGVNVQVVGKHLCSSCCHQAYFLLWLHWMGDYVLLCRLWRLLYSHLWPGVLDRGDHPYCWMSHCRLLHGTCFYWVPNGQDNVFHLYNTRAKTRLLLSPPTLVNAHRSSCAILTL